MANKLELQNLTDNELREELCNSEKHYHTLKFNNAVSTLEKTSELKNARRNIARIHTELRSREIVQQEKDGTLKRDKIRARRRIQKKN
jgi:large subunit ribosomal protein L29